MAFLHMEPQESGHIEGKVPGDCTVPVMCFICMTIILHRHSRQATNLNQNVYERRYLFAVIVNSTLKGFMCSLFL